MDDDRTVVTLSATTSTDEHAAGWVRRVRARRTQLSHSDATDLHWAIVEFDPLRGRESIVTAGAVPCRQLRQELR